MILTSRRTKGFLNSGREDFSLAWTDREGYTHAEKIQALIK